MDEIVWRTQSGATKYSLENGIRMWVRQKTGLEIVHLPSLYRVNFDEMMLMAMAMGYEPTEAERKGVASAQYFLKRERDRRTRQLQPAQVPHPYQQTMTGFCAVCGAIAASRLHDPMTTEGGIKLPIFPQSQALDGESESGLDASFDQKGGPF